MIGAQDPELSGPAREIVVNLVKARIAQCEADLAALGLDFSEKQAA